MIIHVAFFFPEIAGRLLGEVVEYLLFLIEMIPE
jgi:hypothetical protein